MLLPEKTNFIKIALVENHSLVRYIFREHINQYTDLKIVLEVNDAGKLLKELKNKLIEVDVVLLDLFSAQMDGRELLKAVAKLYPSIRPVILSACADQKIINDVFDLGAYGFVSKNSEPEELYEAILSAASGEIYQNKFYYSHQNSIFTPTEIRVLELIWLEKTNEEIAGMMCLSLSTIEKIKHQLKIKSKTKTVVGLIKYALEKRVITTDNSRFR